MADDAARARWNEAYRLAEPGQGEPAQVLKENAHLLPPHGTALDFASGIGNNAVFLARHGLSTEAWDISDLAAEKISQYGVATRLPLLGFARDVASSPPDPQSFDVICVAHYLERSLANPLTSALRPGGLLFYQTFTLEVTADYNGPKNPAFRLAPNELLSLFEGMRIIFYRENALLGNVGEGTRNLAILVAQAT